MSNGFSNPKTYNAKAIVAFADEQEKQLLQIQLGRPDSALIVDEYRNSLRMIRLGAKLKQYNNYHLQQTVLENKVLLNEMKELCSTIKKDHERLWTTRNKAGGLQTSLNDIKNLEKQVDEHITLLEKNGLLQWFSRTGEKIKTAIAVLYLKNV